MNKTAVFEQLKIDEGVVYEVYKDHLGYPTFGVGHLVLESDPEYGAPVGTPVSEERVKECFDNKRDSLQNQYDTKASQLRDNTDQKIKDVETRLNEKLQRALDNPLAN